MVRTSYKVVIRTAGSWPDPNLHNRWPGVGPRYFPINSPVPQRLVTVGTGRWESDGGKTAVGTGQNPKCPEKGVNKKWFGTGIPANVCDDGAAGGRDFYILSKQWSE